jgi:hypothetical protein
MDHFVYIGQGPREGDQQMWRFLTTKGFIWEILADRSIYGFEVVQS